MNRQHLSRDTFTWVLRLFGRYLSDLRYDEFWRLKGMVSSNLLYWVRLNFHFVGFLKKFAIFLVLVIAHEKLKLQIYLLYAILGAQFLLTVTIRPFKTPVLNSLRSLGDLSQILMVLIHHLILED